MRVCLHWGSTRPTKLWSEALEVEQRAVSWLAVLRRTLTYQYFWSKQAPPMKRSLHQQCPPRLSFQKLSSKMTTALISTPSWAQVVGTEADWNIKGEPSPQLNGRRLDLHRGRYYTTMLPSMGNKVTVWSRTGFSAVPVASMVPCAFAAPHRTMMTGTSRAGAERKSSSTCPR